MLKIKLYDLLPAEWNIRVFTDDDFNQICEVSRVSVFECEMQLEGAYCVYAGSPVIFINHALPWPRKLYVKFHELGHHWLHYPGVQFFLNTNNKVELEANIVAVCALIPASLLIKVSTQELTDDYGYPPELIEFRIEVFKTWGI